MTRRFRHYLKIQCSRDCLVYNVLRVGFVALLIFEFLNLMRILTFTLEFTWRGLFITAAMAFIVLESIAYAYYNRKGHMLHWSIWLFIGFALAMDAAADIFHLYGRFQWWDKAVHASNSAIVCFGVFIMVSAFWFDNFHFRLLRQHDKLTLSLLLSATITMTLSALYEIEEYVEDLLYGSNRLGPGTDTANDLLCNALGVLAMIIGITLTLTYLRKRRHHHSS